MKKKNSQYYQHLKANKQQIEKAGWHLNKNGDLKTENISFIRTTRKV